MPLSIDMTDVKVLGGVALVIAGLLVIVFGLWRQDVAMLTFGAGLLGAPGVVSAVKPGAYPSAEGEDQSL